MTNKLNDKKKTYTMRKEYHFWTYIVTNYERTVMYTGVTSNLAQRLKEHYDKRGKEQTFAGRYYCYNLVYYEHSQYIYNAIEREKQIKDMSREKKMKMVSDANPGWKFLNIEICGTWPPAFVGRLAKEEKNTEWNWWDGLVPPFPTE